jgi:hypothetical protein
MSDKFQTFLFEYEHEGSKYALSIKALTPGDAIRRLGSMQNAVYVGILKFSMPAIGPRWLPNLICRIAAFFGKD